MALQQPQQRPQMQPQTGSGPFSGDGYGLKQKILALTPKYCVCDPAGNEVLFVERPVHRIQSLIAIFGALGAAAVVGGVLGFIASKLPSTPAAVVGIFAFVAALVAMVAVGITL